MLKSFSNGIERLLFWFRSKLQSRFAPGVLGAAAFLDNFLFVIPTDGFLMASVMARPRRWLALALIVTTASCLGSACLAYGIKHFGLELLHFFAPQIDQGQAWRIGIYFFDQYGRWAVFLTALTPFTQQPTLALAALAHIPVYEIALLLWLGRMIKYIGMAQLALRMPKLIEQIPLLGSELIQAQNQGEPPVHTSKQ